MSVSKIGMYDPGYGECTLLPKQIRERIILNDRIIKPDLSLNLKSFRSDSPFVSNLKIKEILGLSQDKSSLLCKYRVKKIMTNKIIQKHMKASSVELPNGRYCVLPKIRQPSVFRQKAENALEEFGKGLDHDVVNRVDEIKTRRKIVFSKLGYQSFELVNKVTQKSLNDYSEIL